MSTQTLTASSSHSSLTWTTPRFLLHTPLLQQVKLQSFPDGRLREYIDNLVDIRRLSEPSSTFRGQLVSVRNTHPCLREFTSVYYHHGHHCWVIYANSITTRRAKKIDMRIPLHIGQRPVYITHGNPPLPDPSIGDILPETVDPTILLRDDEIMAIRQAFPFAYGVRLHRWGHFDVLFHKSEDVQSQLRLPLPSRIGSLGIGLVVAPVEAANFSTSACIGLFARAPNFITTVRDGEKKKLEKIIRTSHAREKGPLRAFFQRATDGAEAIFRRKPRAAKTKTYRVSPSKTGKWTNLFPTHFQHDLSLIEPESIDGHLPRMVVPLWHPLFRERFATPEAALKLEGDSAFLLEHECRFHNRRRYQTCSPSPKSVSVLISGVDYLFLEAHHVQRALIWRTDIEDHSMAGRSSGAVVCLRRPTDREVQALLFQNFQTAISEKQKLVAEQLEEPLDPGILITFKGGFFLPPEFLKQATIDVVHEHDLSRTLSYDQTLAQLQDSLPASTSDY
ncbi:hypothetical protein B0H16DRAFT_1619519 [Mycena metata]|uniref:Uncharacterized protein n=1 Tax=Mycena metata TaxID=1033252 RepID=A0AAD7H7L9_9AGAR|nr:hypothetical protein B0H16DRAFT_1619519 [Mycena metata]